MLTAVQLADYDSGEDVQTEKSIESVAGLVAVVTGGASGIGLATAELLKAQGAAVVVIDKNIENGVSDVDLTIECDVTDPGGLNDAYELIGRTTGGIDIQVNSAGVGVTGTVAETADADWLELLDVNVVGVARCIRLALPFLRKSSHASIVNVSSIAAQVGLPNRVCYSASKGAVLAMTRAMAADLVEDQIRVNCVSPGTVDTPWVGRLLGKANDPESERRALEQRQPMGRLGTASEIARTIVFLASPASGFVTGASWSIDGGMEGVQIRARR